MLKRKRSESDLEDIAASTSSYNESSNCDNSRCNISKCWLLQLPLEILEHIFSYLCPRSLKNMKSLHIEIFDIAASKLKSLDFSQYNDVDRDEIALLITPNTAKYIKSLNLNYVFLIPPSHLLKHVTNCKYLTSLSIIDCGITFEILSKILEACKELQELSWTVHPYEKIFGVFPKLIPSYGLKKLYLNLSVNRDILLGAIYIINRSLPLEEVFLNFSSCPFSLMSGSSKITYRLHMDLKCPVKIIVPRWGNEVNNISQHIWRQVECCCLSDGFLIPLRITSPYLQFITRPKDFSYISAIADESVKSSVLYCTSEDDLISGIQHIKRITRKASTSLCLKEKQLQTIPLYISDLSNTRNIPHLQHHLAVNHLVCHYHNIQEFNLTGLHFTNTFDLSALCNVKELTTLSISSCLLKALDYNCSLENNLKNFAKRTKKMQHFLVRGCEVCKYGPVDKEYSAISEWSELRTLSLINVRHLILCHFLRDVTDKCVHLKSVELLVVDSVIIQCMPSIIYMLEKSPQLVYLSFILDYRCTSDSIRKRFWDSVGSSKSLQALCLIQRSSMPVCHKPIVDAIKKLKSLHLFHFMCSTAAGELEKKVRGAMRSNGVNVVKVHIADNMQPLQTCKLRHIYIP